MVLFAIIFVWTPPHFWALAMRYRDDYAAAEVPMLPVVASFARTARQIVAYTVVAVGGDACSSARSPAWGRSTGCRRSSSGRCSSATPLRLQREGTPARSMRLFGWSITYVTLLFGAMAADTLLRAAIGGEA